MATQVVMPKLSPTMEEGQLSRWLKKEGDKVSVGEPLAEVDTDKATMEAQALATGVLRKIRVPEGSTVPVGAIIAIIGEAEEDVSALVSEAGSAAAQTGKKEPAEESKPGGEGAQATAAQGEPVKGETGGQTPSPEGAGGGQQPPTPPTATDGGAQAQGNGRGTQEIGRASCREGGSLWGG